MTWLKNSGDCMLCALLCSFSQVSMTVGGNRPVANVRSVSTSAKTVNGHSVVTKKYVFLIISVFFVSYAGHEQELVSQEQHRHLQSVAMIIHHSTLSEDRIRQCVTLSGSRRNDTVCKSPFPSTVIAVSLFSVKTVE